MSLLMRVKRILDSYVLLSFLLLLSGTFSYALYKQHTATYAPAIEGYDWTQHPEALLIVYPLADSCNTCGLSTTGWINRGLKHRLNVLVIATNSNQILDQIKKEYRSSQVRVITTHEDVIRQFSSGDKIGALRIRMGRILKQQQGGVPPASFFS